MPTIELSPDFAGANGLAMRIANKDGAANFAPSTDVRALSSVASLLSGMLYFNGAANASLAQLHIMKGTVPTDFSSLTTFSSRSADVLITFSSASGWVNGNYPNTSGDFSTSVNGNPIIINTIYKIASASGVATWFWLVTRQQSNWAPTDTLLVHLFGTVGLPGSGSDLEIAETTIASGASYRIQNLKLELPTVWAY